jgi:hypothetical protein
MCQGERAGVSFYVAVLESTNHGWVIQRHADTGHGGLVGGSLSCSACCQQLDWKRHSLGFRLRKLPWIPVSLAPLWIHKQA